MTAKTRQGLRDQVNDLLANNTSAAISPTDVRTVNIDHIDSAFLKEDLYSGAISGDILTPEQITGNQANYAPVTVGSPSQPDYTNANVWRVSSDALREISGIAGGAAGRLIFLLNVGSADIALEHEGAGSTAANRIVTPSLSYAYVTAGGMMALMYDATSSRWR